MKLLPTFQLLEPTVCSLAHLLKKPATVGTTGQIREPDI